MSSSKYIDKICIVVSLLALVFTALFMSGKLPIEAAASTDDDMFSSYDLYDDCSPQNAVTVILNDENTVVDGTGAFMQNGDLYIAVAGDYILSGNLGDGSVIVNVGSKEKVHIVLNGVNIYCSDIAAVYVEQSDKVAITLAENTENTVSSGSDYDTSSKTDGVIYSKDDLSFNGSGTLNVTGEYKHGIVCNDDLSLVDVNMNITAPQDTVHVNDSVKIKDVSLNLTAGDDGITVSNDDETDYLYVVSGTILINECYEGLEATDITIDDGDITIYPTDDALNSMSLMTINGGNITVVNTDGNDADGFDSNGDIVINGGNINISLKNSASNGVFDYGSENGGTFEINGGTIVASGGSGMAESVSDSSTQASIMYYPSINVSDNSSFTVYDSNGNEIVSTVLPLSYSEVTFSSPLIEVGETYTLDINGSSEDITVDTVNYSNSTQTAMAQGGQGGMQNGQMQPFDNQNNNSDMQSPPEKPSGDSDNLNLNEPPNNSFDSSDSSSFDDSQLQPPQMNDDNSQSQPEIPGNQNGQMQGDMKGDMQNGPQQEENNNETEESTDDTQMSYLSLDTDTKVLLTVSFAVIVLALGFAVIYRSKRI